MKLVIQIPCYNEEKTLKETLKALPKHFDGIDEVEILIINDGSSDKTIEVAKTCGINNFVHFEKNRGLAKAFIAGISKSLEMGADIIVNTDADNQYFAGDIEKLIKPILEKKADMVIGARQIDNISHFSILKKLLQKIGSFMVRLLSSTSVIDAPSGFRAFSKNCAENLNIFDNYTYTIETIIQAKAKGFEIISVPIKVNENIRKSRLIKNIFDYIFRSTITMLRMFIIYRPFRFFAIISSLFLLIGFLIGLRFLYFYFTISGVGHIQSLILSAILIITGIQILMIGIIGDLLSINRRLLENLQKKSK